MAAMLVVADLTRPELTAICHSSSDEHHKMQHDRCRYEYGHTAETSMANTIESGSGGREMYSDDATKSTEPCVSSLRYARSRR